MRNCIYCSAALSPDTKPAHVFPAGLGGRLKPRDIVCDGCNNAFSPLERELQEALAHACAVVGAVRDDNSPISVDVSLDGKPYVVAGATADLQPPGTRFDREAKAVVVPLPAGIRNQAKKLARAMHKQGLGPEHVDNLEVRPSGEPEPVHPSGPHMFDLKVGGPPSHKRVAVKMALELLAVHSYEQARRPEFEPARAFARSGTGELRARPDLRSLGSGLLPRDRLPEVFNAIEVWSAGRNVHFRVVYIGALAFTGTLAAEWAGSSLRAAYAFDARQPAAIVASDCEAQDGPPLALWSEAVKGEAVAYAMRKIEAVSQRLRKEVPASAREAPPDADRLRELVREELVRLSSRRRR